jgi:hypothetical protein
VDAALTARVHFRAKRGCWFCEGSAFTSGSWRERRPQRDDISGQQEPLIRRPTRLHVVPHCWWSSGLRSGQRLLRQRSSARTPSIKLKLVQCQHAIAADARLGNASPGASAASGRCYAL